MADGITDLIAQFITVTGADTASATSYIEFSDYDLETAITFYLESGGASIGSQYGGREPRDIVDENDSAGEEDDAALSRRLQEEEYRDSAGDHLGTVREAIAPVTETLVNPEYGGFNFGGHINNLHNPQHFNMPSIFNQRGAIRRPQNAFEDDEEAEVVAEVAGGIDRLHRDVGVDSNDDSEIEIAQAPLGRRARRRIERERRANGIRSVYHTELATGMSNMTPAQSRLARIFQPPFELIENLDLESVSVFCFLRSIMTCS